MKIGSLFEVWIGLKTQDIDLFMLGIGLAVLGFGLAVPESNLCLIFRWHGQAKIGLGRALHKISNLRAEAIFWLTQASFA